MTLLLALLACGPAPERPAVSADSAAPAAVEHREPASPARLLRRMSLDLRGTTPTLAEVAAVEADPASLARLRAEMLADPRFEERLVELFGEQWWTLVDVFDIRTYDYGLPNSEEYALRRSMGEEPLRLLAHVGAAGLPWSEVVTADYTMANPLLGSIWPLERPAGEGEWLPSKWTDGRPAAGVLASTGLWLRYRSNPFNQNRSRAAAVFRLLTCTDILARPVQFSSAARPVTVEEQTAAILNDPYCLACHSAIEPVATSLFGFWVQVQYNVEEVTYYHPEREALAARNSTVQNAWFGEPVYGLSDLGLVISQDPRFTSCAVKTMARALWRREPTLEDLSTIQELDAGFQAGGQRLPALVTALTETPQYTVGGFAEGAAADELERERTVALLSAEQLRTVFADLTGYTWEDRGVDLLRDDGTGYRVLAGGVNGTYVTQAQTEPGLTWALVSQRLAQASAATVVTHDLVVGASPRRLLDRVTLASQPEDPEFGAQLEDLSLRTLSRRPTADEAAELEGLWVTVSEADGPAAAWSAVLVALFLDPEFLTR